MIYIRPLPTLSFSPTHSAAAPAVVYLPPSMSIWCQEAHGSSHGQGPRPPWKVPLFADHEAHHLWKAPSCG